MSWVIEKTLGDFIDFQANAMPYQKAMITPAQDFTFRELTDISDLLARGLLELGVSRGDRVAVLAPNIPEWVLLFLAVSKLGAILVPLGCNAQVRDLYYVLGKTGVKVLFLVNSLNETDYLAILNQALPDLHVSGKGKVRSQELPFLRHVVTISEGHHSNLLNFNDVLHEGRKAGTSSLSGIRARVLAQDAAVIKYTNGLSGYSRGAVLSHFSLINNAHSVAQKLNLGPSDKLCLPIPLYYIFGFWVGLVASVITHTPVVMIPKYNALEVIKAIEQERCSVLYGVPTLFSDLLNHPTLLQSNLKSLRTGIMSADYCPPELVKKAMDDIGIPELTVAYGITEVGAITQTGWNDSHEKTIHTVGQPLAGIEIRVVNPKDGTPLPPDEVGELYVRSPCIMKGYYNMPQETSEVIDGEGWFHTGDLGMRDHAGYFKITGRNRNVIIRGGENIYPREVEALLLTHPDIGDVRIVGVPSRRLGEEVYAFITATNGTECNAQGIREYFRNKMSRHMTPRWVKTIDTFPRGKDGKVDRNQLRRWAIADLELRDSDYYQVLYSD